ncbi:Ankyrin repeat-containing domain protein [Rhypophila sp. PSN 637]
MTNIKVRLKKCLPLLTHPVDSNPFIPPDCLTSLRNLELQELKPIKDMDIYGLDWLWEDSEYKGWKAAEHSSILCVSGKPASGKSFLWRFTLDTFLKEGMLTKGHNVLAWFFFDENYPETRTRRAMLEKLLYDLLNNTRSFFPYFQPRLRRLVTEMQRDGEHDRGDVVWDEEDLEDVLSSIVQHPIPQTIYVLIDGLDEAKDPLECAESLTRCLFRDIETQVRVKLLVATRRGVDVDRCFVKAFKRHAKPVHRITQQDRNRGDILEYSKSFLNDSLARELGWSSEDAEECRQFLVNQSQGIFLWATLAKDLIKEYLEDIREASLRDFFDFLHGIPKDIGDLYRRIIQRLVDRFKDSKDGRDHLVKGKMMFQIAAQAKTSLSIHEFHDIYILPWPESRDLSLELKGLKDRRVPNLENIIPRYTGNLLEINQKKNTVEMLHPTLTEFLRNENIGDFNWPAVLYDEGSTIQTVALACLRYLEYVSLELTQNSWSPSEIGENELDGFNSFARIINNYPFLLYSLRHTASHFKSAQPGDVEKLVKVFIRMCESPIRFLLRDWILKQAESLPRLLLSLKGRVQHLTRQETRSFQNCVLHCAAHLGLSTAVRVALIAGADTRSLSTLHPSRETAICLAIIPFKERVDLPEIIVRILLENGADPNVAAHKFTPLHFAGKFMREAVVEILLKHNANVHARDSQDMTPLHRTIMGSSHASLAQETEDADHTPRTTPSGPRDVSLVCVQKLLEAGADIHAADSQGRKPIHWAAGLRDNVPLIEALLNSEKNKKRRKRAVNEKCNVEETVPLHWASGHGHQETVKYLLKNGARAGWADKRGKTALNWAARYGHDGILRNLLDALPGTDQEVKAVVDRQELGGRTALIWAAQKGHTCCVKLLVDNGADVNLAEDDEEIGGTPLSWAVTYGHIEIITLLFKHDVAVDGKRSILAWALASGRIEVFQILQTETIKRSEILNPDEPDLDGNTGFMLAAARGHVKVLEYLYKMNQDRTENINFHLQNNEDSTALHLAAGWGHIHAVRWLVETAELDVTHANVYGSTALHLAAYWGRHNVMKYLKSRQVNTTLVRDKKGLRYTDCLRDFENRQKE